MAKTKLNRCPTCGQSIAEPKSTGYRSQNSKVRGDSAAISEQIEGRWTPDMVYELMKRMAVSEGVYPGIKYKTDKLTLVVPISMADADAVDADGLIKTIQEFADKNNFWLWKYTEDGLSVYRSVGGRTMEEMKKDSPNFDICMRSAKP